jgi:hypothetical protein
MLTTNPKSRLQKKLVDVQKAAAHIAILTEVRSDLSANAYYGGAIDAGIAALAAQIDSEIDSEIEADTTTCDSALGTGNTPHPDSLTDEQLEAIAGGAFSPQHVKLIRDRLGEIVGKVYLAANLAYLIAPDSEKDIEMHTVLSHISDVLQNVAGDLDSNWVLSNKEAEPA